MSEQVNTTDGEKRRPLLAETTIPLDEAAKLYGVTPTSIRRWISEGRVKGYRFGTLRIRVDLDSLEGMFTEIGPGA